MKKILAVLCVAIGLLTAGMISTGSCVQKYPLGDTGLPVDYDRTILNYQDAITDYDAFLSGLPSSFNWKTLGKVTPAKDQKNCGGCWSFAATGVFESKLLMKKQRAYNLSEQQQISCNTEMAGCNGGDMTSLRFWESEGPWFETCTGYPSRNGKVPSCSSFNCAELEWRTTDYYTVHMTIGGVKTSLFTDGPAYFRFDVYSDFYTFWQGDAGNVYKHTEGDYEGGHAVLLIGWDDEKGAWLLKNSWGATSGPNGNGTFWMAYKGHIPTLRFGVANVLTTSTKLLLERKKLMLLRKPAGTGPYGIQVFEPPQAIGAAWGGVLAGFNNLGQNFLDVSAAGFSTDTGDELVILRKTAAAGKKGLSLFDAPTLVNQTMGSPLATANVASRGKYVTSGDFDGDGSPEIAVAQLNSSTKTYSLSIYRPPATVGGTATLIASSPNIGKNVMCLAAAQYRRTIRDELFVLRGNANSAGLYIYQAPSAVDAPIGDPIASAANIGGGIIGIAAGNFDADPTNVEVAILMKAIMGGNSLKITRPPANPDGSLGTLVASANSLGDIFVGIKAALLTPAIHVNAPDSADEPSPAPAND
jgi:hypothetical protein